MKVILTRTMKATSRTDPAIVHVSACGQYRLVKEGTVLDHAESYRLCMMGVAKPEDAECLQALADNGWGPDVFDEKWLTAEAQMKVWAEGIRAANTSTPEPVNTEDAEDESGDTDSGSILFDSTTPED